MPFPGTKKVVLSLPHHLLADLDAVVALEKRSRSEMIREALLLYLQERKKKLIRAQLQDGYMEMARLNLALANEAIGVENEADRLAGETVGE